MTEQHRTLPEAFLKSLRDLLGNAEAASLAQTIAETPPATAVRLNPRKPFGGFGDSRKVDWCSNGLILSARPKFTLMPALHAGCFYVQEPSSMIYESLVSPLFDMPVKALDLCAAPGGKSISILEALPEGSLLVANEYVAQRAAVLKENLIKWGRTEKIVTNSHPRQLEALPGEFDLVAVDAPCSGEGMFRKDPEAARVWSPEKSAACAKQQREIISQAARMLRPGGLLLYSTCTFSPEENEQIIAGLLRERQDMRLMDLEGYEGFGAGRPDLADGNPDLVKCVRIWPHRMAGEGHFLALLQKEGEAGRQKERPASERPGLSKGERKSLEEFFSEVSGFAIDRMEVRKGRVYYRSGITEEQKGLTFLRNGLYLGELKKDRFEPGQAFAMALKKDSYGSVLDFGREDERVVRYLKGETVTVDDLPVGRRKGWQLVCVEGYPLGWGKLVNGTLKNKYASGWRMKE